MALMQRESANLDRQFKLIEKSYGTDHLDLVLVNGSPDQRIADVKKVETVFKAGIGFDSARMIEAVRALVGVR